MNEYITEILRQHAKPLVHEHDLDELIEMIGNKKVVMLGEASHGTKEYYEWRMEITKRLISEKGFSFVAVEGDWPDCYEINRYVKQYKEIERSADLLLRHSFKRWPTWMWANEEMREMIEWLHLYNLDQLKERKVGFYGLDVYSLADSLNAIIRYIEQVMPEARKEAYNAYYCFDAINRDMQDEWMHKPFVKTSCQKEVITLLTKLRQQAPIKERDEEEMHFNVEQNTLVTKNAEEYYRAMLKATHESWNIRDRHMAEILDRLLTYYEYSARQEPHEIKAIVWAHNTHIGDARATSMKKAKELNIGQLAREVYGEDHVALVGFGSYTGSVIAGYSWGAPMMKMNVPPARRGSWEDLFHAAEARNRIFLTQQFRNDNECTKLRAHRAIGVVYNPQSEGGNYVPSNLVERYDAFIYIDRTQALHPLPMGRIEVPSVPETFPVGE